MTDNDPFSSPIPADDVETLLRQGIDDARRGDRASARIKFERVVELDDQNEKAWFWLASVVDTDVERQAALDKVLEINPNNDRARKALDALEARMEQAQAAAKPASKDRELIPGVSRNQLVLALAIAGAVTLALVCVIVTLVSVSTGNQAAASAQQAQNDLATIAAVTAVAQAATQQSADMTATQFALATPTSARPTLPPTWTPTPAPTDQPTAAMIPPPIGAAGILGMWGGRDVENIGFYPVGVVNLNAGTTFEPIGDALGRDVSIYANGQRAAYTWYDRVFFATNLQAANLNGSSIENIGERFNSVEVIEPEMPSYSPNGQSLLFVAKTPTSGEARQVFLLSLVDSSLRNLSNDLADYTYPRMSPDGNRMVAVRNDVAAGQGVDLALIDVVSGGKFGLTSDQNTLLETHPRWSPDGTQIIFSAALASDPENHDIYLRNADGSGTSSALYATADDELYPSLSPNAQFLAFASNRDGQYQVYTLDLQSQTLGQLTTDPGAEYFPGDWWGQ